MFLKQIVVVLSLCFCTATFAQIERSDRSVMVYDKLNMAALPGATVTLGCRADTIRGVAIIDKGLYGVFAQFRHGRSFKDSVTVEVSFLGHKPFKKRFSPLEVEGIVHAEMIEDEKQIAQIIVVADRIAMVVKGDTTIYNSSAFKTLQGDRFAELIKQLPGVEIRGSAIYASGEEVKRVYIDGKNMFGTKTEYALTDLEASDVKSVKVYDEPSKTGGLNDKDKVMDVATNSKRNVLKGGSVAASGGGSFMPDYSGKREVRHAEALTIYRHSELGNWRADFSNSSNDNNGSMTRITPTDNLSANMGYTYRRGDTTVVIASGEISRNKNSKTQSSFSDYFPTADYTSRHTSNMSQSSLRTLSAKLGNYTTIKRRKNTYNVTIDGSLGDNITSSDNASEQTIDTETISTKLIGNNKIRTASIAGTLFFVHDFSKKSRIQAMVAERYAKNSGIGLQIDTTASVEGLRLNLRDNSSGVKNTISARVEYETETSESSSFSVRYIYERAYDKSRRLSLDYLDSELGVADNINSYDYTVNTSQNSLLGAWQYKKNAWEFRTAMEALIYSVVRDERLPSLDNSPHTFYLLNPSINIVRQTATKRFSFRAHFYNDDIPVEALRTSLDATDPMNVHVGNANITPPKFLGGDISYRVTNPKRASSIELKASAVYMFDFMTSRRTLFMEDTYLPEYDYTMLKGSQLSSYESVDGRYDIKASVGYSQRVGFLKSTLHTTLEYVNKCTPYFLGETLYKSDNNDMSLLLGLNTGFSSKVRINFSSRTAIGLYTSQSELRRYIREVVDGTVNVSAGKYFALVSAIYEYYNNNSPSMRSQSNAMINASAGRKFGKENKFSASIGVVDITNSSNYLKTVFNTDYVNTSSESYLGRYGYLKVEYMF